MFVEMLWSVVQLVLVAFHATALEKSKNPGFGLYNPAIDKAFCPIKCGRHGTTGFGEAKDVHVACHCNSQYMKTCLRFEEESVTDFRLAMTFAHNVHRNTIAAGEFKGLPSASNMNAVSYSLALEYSAECSANSCKKEFIPCLRIENFQFVSQNQYLAAVNKSKKSVDFAEEAVDKWLNASQAPGFTDVLAEYAEGGEWKEAAAMLWSSVLSIGCAINHNNVSVLVVCNYGGTGDMTFSGGRVYREGKPCTQCQDRGAPCNDEFESLCRRIEDVPIGVIHRPGLSTLYNISASGKYGSPPESKQDRIRGNEVLGFLSALTLLALHF